MQPTGAPITPTIVIASPPTVNMPPVPTPTGAPPAIAYSGRYQVVGVTVTVNIVPPSLKVLLWPTSRRIPLNLEDCCAIFVDPATAPVWHIGRVVTLSIGG